MRTIEHTVIKNMLAAIILGAIVVAFVVCCCFEGRSYGMSSGHKFDTGLGSWQDKFRFRRLDLDPELLKREAQIREKELIWRPDVQYWLEKAAAGWPSTRKYSIEKLDIIIQGDEGDDVRLRDCFRPYGQPHMINEGGLHLLNQVDGVRWSDSEDILVRGGLLAGPQGAGKTREIVYIASQLTRASPPRRLLILDPKAELANYADQLDAVVVDISQISLDFRDPLGRDRAGYLHRMIPQIGGVASLIQGVGVMHEAADIVLRQLDIASRAAGEDFELCLRDLRLALPLIPGASNFKRQNYVESAETALGRLELGSGSLFACRRGVSISRLIDDQNVILTARGLTDERCCRLLTLMILYHFYTAAEVKPPTMHLERLIIIDDAQRFVSRDFQENLTTPTAHILATLRSSGTGVLSATQLPSQVDPGVLALSNLSIVVGGVHGGEDRDVVSHLLGLNPPQKQALGRMVPREALGYYSGAKWRYPIHGWTPDVADPEPNWDAIHERSEAFVNSLGILPWRNLFEFREVIAVHTEDVPTPKPTHQEAAEPGSFELEPSSRRLLSDCMNYPYDKYTDRLERLQLSGREGFNARNVLEQDGLVESLSIGQGIFLIPTSAGCGILGSEPPTLLRGDSLQHFFLRSLAHHHLIQDGSVDRIEVEVPVGDTGATVDLVVHRRDGSMEAYEITSSVGNVTGNAVKAGGEGFSRIVFLCRDHGVRQGVWARLQKSGLSPDLARRIRCLIFSSLWRKTRGR